ncbi:MAG: betaine-aldehyde dehydrogenase [Thermoleophilaceae bacterium]|nr:betaine-aldehyde dehydrogenase [Thermoleophilaceae bacterium]
MSTPVAVTDDVQARLDEVRTHEWKMLVGGELVPARSGATFTTWSPSTLDPIAEVPDPAAEDIDEIVQAAARGAEEWGRMSVQDRAKAVRRLTEALAEHEAELGFLDALDGGNPVTAMRGDVRMSVELMQLYTDWALELKGETIPATPDHLHYTVREPYGVVVRIVPYNHPLMFAAARSAAPLVAGNSVIVKAPDQTPLSALRLGEIWKDLLPPGVFSVVGGQGATVGDALVRHPLVRRIAFIGSVPTGQAIMRAAAESGVKNVTLELGGKNPMIAFPDADVDRVIDGAVRGMNFHWTAGQSCGSNSRLLLHESLVDKVLPGVIEGVEAVRMGSPLDPDTQMGTMVSQAQFDKVMRYIGYGRDQGATLLTGGGRPEGAEFERGHYIAPTVFGDVTPDMRIAQEEIFGPVMSVLTFRDEDEAVALANGVDYGLTASVWTNDLRRAHRMAARVASGFVWVNDSSKHFPGAPFGGYKNSGVGREEGLEEMLSFTQVKTVNVNLV